MAKTPQDYLAQAAALAARVGARDVSPNPRVGCVVVRQGKIIAQGVHEFFGGPHAEANALRDIIKNPPLQPSDLEVYITLEPCDHFPGKKTGSCSDILLKIKPRKVWVGALDPSFNGQSLKKLEVHGIETELLDSAPCQNLNPFFKTWITQKRPFINLKLAQSLNSKITSHSRHITNDLSRTKVHEMRARHRAILTTTKTILADNPQLNVRLKDNPNIQNPDIIILGKTPLPKELNLFKIPNREIYPVESLKSFISLCQEKKIDSVMTEGGSELTKSLFEANLVDKISLFTAPIWLPQSEKNTFIFEKTLNDYRLSWVQALGDDVLFEYQKAESQ